VTARHSALRRRRRHVVADRIRATAFAHGRHRARRHPRRACAVSSMSGSQCGVLPARTGAEHRPYLSSV